MDKGLWLKSCSTLCDSMSHFEVPPGCGHGSSLNADGTPFQIAWASNGKEQATKVIVDPFPYLPAREQRQRVLERLTSWLGPCQAAGDSFFRHIENFGSISGGKANRFWVASSLDRLDTEIYSALAGETMRQREKELDRLMGRLDCRVPFSLSGFRLGPVSISSRKNSLSVYLRPNSVEAVLSFLPGELAEFLSVFSGNSVNSNGLLMCVKLCQNDIVGIKLDLCGHCVTPNEASSANVANKLGNGFMGRPIELPPGAKTAFWGASYTPKGLRIYVYLVPKETLSWCGANMFKGYNNRGYVGTYRDLYVNDDFWAPKYQCNEAIIRNLQKGEGKRVWVDLCCGQSQYFCISDRDDDIKCVGIDASREQLMVAQKFLQNTGYFIVADAGSQNLPLILEKAHLVTLMWGAYCYFGGLDEIRIMIENVARVLPRGGAFYLEVIEPTTLENFNGTNFARLTGASVRVNGWDGDLMHWTYEDYGGEHHLIAPTLDWVLNSMFETGLLSKCVTTVQTLHQVVGFRQ